EAMDFIEASKLHDEIRAELTELRRSIEAAALHPVSLQGFGSRPYGAWEDIATAPRNGDEVDLWHRGVGRLTDVRWWEYRPGFFGWMRASDIYEGSPLDDRDITHWMRRPLDPGAQAPALNTAPVGANEDRERAIAAATEVGAYCTQGYID